MYRVPTALVTGSSRGIGRGIAIELGSLGYGVVVNYVHNEPAARETAASVDAAGGCGRAIRADVSSAADRERLVCETLAAFGRIDVLVNNAGVPVAERADLLEATEESWDRILAINLKAPYFLSQRVAREMIRLTTAGVVDRPKIINISSVSAYAASANRGEYCVAKAGMTMMTWLFAEIGRAHV